MSKKQKIKGNNWKVAKENANVYLAFGLNETEFAEFVKQYPNQTDILWQEYREIRARNEIQLNPELLEYSNHIKEMCQQRQNNKIEIYFPLFELLKYSQVNDVAIAFAKSKFDWTYQNKDGGRKPYFKGMKDAFIVGELFRSAELILVDKTQNEIITKYTEFKEVEKVKTETRIITQEKKVGLTQKEIDKALEKTKRKFEKSFFDQTLFNQILEDVKNNLK
jgi:hypothetical protein